MVSGSIIPYKACIMSNSVLFQLYTKLYTKCLYLTQPSQHDQNAGMGLCRSHEYLVPWNHQPWFFREAPLVQTTTTHFVQTASWEPSA